MKKLSMSAVLAATVMLAGCQSAQVKEPATSSSEPVSDNATDAQTPAASSHEPKFKVLDKEDRTVYQALMNTFIAQAQNNNLISLLELTYQGVRDQLGDKQLVQRYSQVTVPMLKACKNIYDVKSMKVDQQDEGHGWVFHELCQQADGRRVKFQVTVLRQGEQYGVSSIQQMF